MSHDLKRERDVPRTIWRGKTPIVTKERARMED